MLSYSETRIYERCRPIIRVDGCFLKGPHGGILLTAVGVDPNNNLFPIANCICFQTTINLEKLGNVF